jgi:hypothetical protein
MAREHGSKETYLLKIYLPQGTKCAYINQYSAMDNEHEILLPCKTTLKVLHCSRIRKYLECIVVEQE